MKASATFGKSEPLEQTKCFAIFFALLLPIGCFVAACNQLYNPITRYVLFFAGWFVWSFAEYILHRFWNHDKAANKNNSIVQRHHHHHTHPTEIKVSGKHRALMILLSISLISLSFWTSPYLMIVAGIETGIFWFFMMHYFLHQKWARKVFPRLVTYHVVHHCKEPDTCYGISTAWWDRLFRTTPQLNKTISQKVLAFYYQKDSKKKRGTTISSLIDEKLSDGANESPSLA